MAKEHNFKMPQDVVLKVQPTKAESLFDEETKTEKTGEAVDWLDLPTAPVASMGEYPYDGAPVFLTSNGDDFHEGVWRTSRTFGKTSWVTTSFWARRNAGGAKIGFEPLGYKKISE